MENNILSLVFDLKDEIVKSELYKDLKEKEKEMINNQECFKLLHSFQILQDEYKQAKRFEKYGANTENILQKLSNLKILIDENKHVKEYNIAYKKMRKKIKEIEKIILKDITERKQEINIEE